MKRTMTKITAAALAIMIAFCVVIGTASQVFAAGYGTADLTMVADKTVAGPGTEIKVSLTLEDLTRPTGKDANAGIAGVQIFFKWDSTLFDYVSIEKGARLNEIDPNLYNLNTTTSQAVLNSGYGFALFQENNSGDVMQDWLTKELYPGDEILVLTLRVKSTVTQETTTTIGYGAEGRYITEFVWSSGGKIDYTIDTSGSTITVKSSVDFTLDYVDYNDRTNKLATSDIRPAVPGQPFTATAKNNITDWVAVGYQYGTDVFELQPGDFIENVDVPVVFTVANVTQGGTVQFLYKEDKNNNKIPDEYEDFVVTSKYTGVDQGVSTAIQPDAATGVAYGDAFSETSPQITDWVIRSVSVNGVETGRLQDSDYDGTPKSLTATIASVEADATVEFFYDKDENGDDIPDPIQKTITTTFSGDDGTQNLENPVTAKVKVGDSYSINSPQITDWVIESYTIDGNPGTTLNPGDYDGTPKSLTAAIANVQNDAAINFVYTADNNNDNIPDKYQYIVTTKYTNEDGTVEIQNSKTTDVNYNGSYSETNPSITGWIVESWTLNGVEQGRYNEADYQLNNEIFFTANLTNIQSGQVIQFQYTEDTNGDKIPDKYQDYQVTESHRNYSANGTIGDRILSDATVQIPLNGLYTNTIERITVGSKNYVAVGYQIDNDAPVIINDLAAWQNNTVQPVTVNIPNVAKDYQVVYLYMETESPVDPPIEFMKNISITYKIDDVSADGQVIGTILETETIKILQGTNYTAAPKTFNGVVYNNGTLDNVAISDPTGTVVLTNVAADHTIVFNYKINDPTSNVYRLWHAETGYDNVTIDEWCISNLTIGENLPTFISNLSVGIGTLEYYDVNGNRIINPSVYDRMATGYTVKHIVDNKVFKEWTVIIFGDVSQDGRITSDDFIAVEKFISMVEDLAPAQYIAANYDRDGNYGVSINDLTMMRDAADKFVALNQSNIPGEDVPPLD